MYGPTKLRNRYKFFVVIIVECVVSTTLWVGVPFLSHLYTTVASLNIVVFDMQPMKLFGDGICSGEAALIGSTPC